jgi:nucleotide-binding universal stress UspA family protein
MPRIALERDGPMIVATDGTEQSDAAIRMALLLAQSSGAAVQVIGVVQSVPVPSPDLGIVPPPMIIDDARRAEMLDSITHQIEAVAGPRVGWPIHVEHGHPPRTIVRLAREHGAALIVLGLGRHRMMDRLIGSETAVQVLRLTTVPVLAVPPGCDALPRLAVAAVDFSELSVAAAHGALGVLHPDGALHLVHVNTGAEDLLDERRDEARVSHAWEGVMGRLGDVGRVTVHTLTLSGTPGRELLSFARASHADLLVAGTHGRGAFQRLVLGSVATQLLRGAECSVLVTPLARPNVPERPEDQHIAVDRARFAERLELFTRRNVGRRCALEVDDPELGAQEQTLDYPFLGAAYDARDRRVTLWLGDVGTEGRHLTRSIGGVTRIDVLQDRDGWDQVLRLAHGSGQTLLTFAR